MYLPTEWTDDRPRWRGAGLPDAAPFATKIAPARRMIERAIAAGCRRRGWPPRRCAVRTATSGSPWITRVRALLAEVPAAAWRRASRLRGSKGPRRCDWAITRINCPEPAADLAPVLRQWVIDGPAACGLDRANRTDPELADHLYKTKGLRVGTSAIQGFGRERGIRPYRPTYRSLRGDPAEQAARDEPAALERGPTRASWPC